MMRTSLLALALASTVPAQMTALVNDPMSHGTLGDNKLSLDEAIRVMNLALSYGQLSTLEQQQMRNGPTSILDTIEIDFNITPVITIEPGKQLTHIEGDQISHVDTNFYGLNGRPIIQGGNTPIVFEVNTNHFHLHDIIIIGGQIGITFDSSLHYHFGRRARLLRCLLLNQTQIGYQVNIPQFPPGEILPLDFVDSVFNNMPVAIQVIDRGLSANLDLTGHNVKFQNCDVAIDLDVRGNSSQCTLLWDRIKITGADNAVRVRRPTQSSSVVDLRFVHSEMHASQSAIDIENSVIGAMNVALHHLDVQAGSGSSDYAFRSYPSSGRLDLTIGESVFNGNVQMQIGNVGAKLDVQNSRFENGSFDIRTTGPSGTFVQNVHQSTPITVASGTTKPVSFKSCEFVRSSIDDQSAGTATANGCYFGSSTASPNVVNNSPAPAPWIGRASVVPNNPPLGGQVDLSLDLQPNTAAAWLLGLAEASPNILLPQPRYMSFLVTLGIPGPFTAQSTLRIVIPNDPSIQGVELYGQPVVFPTAGQPYVPLSLPRGGRFVIE